MALISRRAAATALALPFAQPALAARDLPDVAGVLRPVNPPREPPDGVFLDANGGEHDLSEFRGHGMVINFWATWCRPCVEEMPSLAALSKALAPRGIAVMPLSSDRGGAAQVSAWYEAKGVTGLPVLLDPKGALARAWGSQGIPATRIIGRDGLERAWLEGAADWSTPAAVALIARLAG